MFLARSSIYGEGVFNIGFHLSAILGWGGMGGNRGCPWNVHRVPFWGVSSNSLKGLVPWSSCCCLVIRKAVHAFCACHKWWVTPLDAIAHNLPPLGQELVVWGCLVNDTAPDGIKPKRTLWVEEGCLCSQSSAYCGRRTISDTHNCFGAGSNLHGGCKIHTMKV